MAEAAGSGRRGLLALGLGGVVVWAIKQYVMPGYDPCPACDAKGRLSCGAPDCDHGQAPCRGGCLKRDTPGWQRLNLAGFPPEMLFMKYENDDDTWTAWSERHIGDVVEKVNGRWLARKCPTCGGTGKAPCPACDGKKLCGRCGGSAMVRRWLF